MFYLPICSHMLTHQSPNISSDFICIYKKLLAAEALPWTPLGELKMLSQTCKLNPNGYYTEHPTQQPNTSQYGTAVHTYSEIAASDDYVFARPVNTDVYIFVWFANVQWRGCGKNASTAAESYCPGGSS